MKISYKEHGPANVAVEAISMILFFIIKANLSLLNEIKIK